MKKQTYSRIKGISLVLIFVCFVEIISASSVQYWTKEYPLTAGNDMMHEIEVEDVSKLVLYSPVDSNYDLYAMKNFDSGGSCLSNDYIMNHYELSTLDSELDELVLGQGHWCIVVHARSGSGIYRLKSFPHNSESSEEENEGKKFLHITGYPPLTPMPTRPPVPLVLQIYEEEPKDLIYNVYCDWSGGSHSNGCCVVQKNTEPRSVALSSPEFSSPVSYEDAINWLRELNSMGYGKDCEYGVLTRADQSRWNVYCDWSYVSSDGGGCCQVGKTSDPHSVALSSLEFVDGTTYNRAVDRLNELVDAGFGGDCEYGTITQAIEPSDTFVVTPTVSMVPTTITPQLTTTPEPPSSYQCTDIRSCNCAEVCKQYPYGADTPDKIRKCVESLLVLNLPDHCLDCESGWNRKKEECKSKF